MATRSSFYVYLVCQYFDCFLILLVNAAVKRSTGGVACIHQILRKTINLTYHCYSIALHVQDKWLAFSLGSLFGIYRAWDPISKPWGGRQHAPVCQRRLRRSPGGCSYQQPWWQSWYGKLNSFMFWKRCWYLGDAPQAIWGTSRPLRPPTRVAQSHCLPRKDIAMITRKMTVMVKYW